MPKQSSSGTSRRARHPRHRIAAAPEPVEEVPVTDAATDEDPTVFESRVHGEHLVAKLTAIEDSLHFWIS